MRRLLRLAKFLAHYGIILQLVQRWTEWGDTMPKRLIRYIPAVVAGLLCTVIALSPITVRAADCIEQPSGEPGPGAHWYYHSDHVNNRKCWYLAEAGIRTIQTEALAAQPSPTQPPVEQAAKRPALPLTEAEREALFQEFLRWKVQHTLE